MNRVDRDLIEEPSRMASSSHGAPALLRRWTWSAVASLAVIAAAGCASTPIPNEKIAVAKASVQRAESAGAVEFAPVEIQTARDKLARAEKAAAEHEAQPATQLAEQANVDAQLAEATAQQHKSHKAAMELDASLQALRNESSRNAAQSTQ